MRLFFLLTLLTGFLYPLIILAFAQLIMPFKANGSLIKQNNHIIGSELIGQKFESNKYVWGRPSAVDYNPLNSGASNLSWISAKLKKLVEDRIKKMAQAHSVDASQVPSELVFASASGLEPYITYETALFQVDRIVKARGWNDKGKELLIQTIQKQSEQRFLGPSIVNVLKLNLEIDKLKP